MVRSAVVPAFAMLIATLALVGPSPAATDDDDPVGGAIIGATMGAAISGLQGGGVFDIVNGAVVGGNAGYIMGSAAPSRPGYSWHDGDCFRHERSRLVRVTRRYCY
jgi:hypothetical protein